MILQAQNLNNSSNLGISNTATIPMPFIHDEDGGSTDKGDLAALVAAIQFNRLQQISLSAAIVTCGDVFTAPATRDILDFYSLQAVPLGAYMGVDCHVGGGAGTPARMIRDRDLPAATRSNYTDAATLYQTVLTAVPNNSVIVYVGGFLNSIAQFLNASGANVTLWNQKVRAVILAAGQWPNSSSTASPAGNFLNTGGGEWNVGGSDAGSSVGAAEAQAATDFVSKSTVPHYWHGVEICGNVGNSPALAEFINSTIPDTWSTTNPAKFGWGSGTRTAWDIMGVIAAVNIGLYGANNPYWTVNQIATPTFSTAQATAGQNTSTAGSSKNFYLTPNLGALTLTQWRTAMSTLCNSSIGTGT